MLGISHVIILSLIVTINVANPGKSDIVYPADFEEADISSLKPITSRQALPLILFESDYANMPLRFPTDLTQAEIKDGRLASGTEFYTRRYLKEKEVYFCPAASIGVSSNCLIPVDFGNSEVLECKVEPSPLIFLKSKFTSCGPDGIGISLQMVFTLCKAQEPYSFATTGIIVYSFCYHESSKRVLFVSYPIFMAKFLTGNLLAREREIQFQRLSTHANSAINEDFHEILDAAAKLFQKVIFHSKSTQNNVASY